MVVCVGNLCAYATVCFYYLQKQSPLEIQYKVDSSYVSYNLSLPF